MFSFIENTIFFNKKTMFSYLEKGISRNIWSCDLVSASDIDLLRIFMCFCIIFVMSAPFSHHFLLHYDGFCSFTATSHVTTTASEMLCTKAFQETCGSVAAKTPIVVTILKTRLRESALLFQSPTGEKVWLDDRRESQIIQIYSNFANLFNSLQAECGVAMQS